MKILALADASYIHTQKWAQYFSGRGYELEIVSFRPAELDYAQVHYVETGVARQEGGNWHYLLGLPEVRQLIMRTAPDLVFCHYLTSYGFVGALLKSSHPLAIWLHGTDILVTPNRSPLYRLMARFALARSDLIVLSAPHMNESVRKLGGGSKRAIVVPVGADTTKFNISKPLARMDFTCITSRLLTDNSNVDIILEAFVSVRQIRPNIQVTIAGDGSRRPHLERLAHRLDLASCVTFLGQVPNEAMPDLLRSHALYVAATSSDGTSISLLEAMACGTFPIVSDIPANRPWIKSGTNGFLVSPGRSDLLADRILEALASPGLMARAQRINWEVVKERGDYVLNMQEVEKAVVQLLEGESLQ